MVFYSGGFWWHAPASGDEELQWACDFSFTPGSS
jgi:hypothetical protein